MKTVDETKQRILLVEDDQNLAIAISRWLDSAGFDVHRVESGGEGIVAAKGQQWGLILSDIEMPGMNGLEMTKQLREANIDTPLLLMTAHHKTEYAIEALRNDANDFILKPLNKEELLAKVTELIDSHRQSKDVILAIGAHPDDVEIGCGGILLKHRDKGDDVTILTLSGGEVGGDSSLRVVESSSAAQRLGANLIHTSLVDTKIGDGRETITIIEQAIKDTGATIVYTHTNHDNHQDHRNTHYASVVACRPVPNLYCYQAPSSNIEFMPSVFVDITNYLDGKLDAISVYQTQVATRKYLTDELIRSTAVYWGRFGGYRKVEPLEVIRSVN